MHSFRIIILRWIRFIFFYIHFLIFSTTFKSAFFATFYFKFIFLYFKLLFIFFNSIKYSVKNNYYYMQFNKTFIDLLIFDLFRLTKYKKIQF